MHSWRLIRRCAAVSLALAMVMTGFVLSRAGDRPANVGALDTAVNEQRVTEPPAAQMAPSPRTEKVPAPDGVERAKPIVKVVQTSVPVTSPDAAQGDLVAALPDTRTQAFNLLGVTWSAKTTEQDIKVHVRTRVDGNWTKWQGLELDDASSGGRPGTEPLWVGKGDGVAVRVSSAARVTPADIKIVTVDSGSSESNTNTVTPALYPTDTAIDGTAHAQQVVDGSPTYTPQPAIISRSTWGASAGTPCDSPRVGSTTRGVVIHHTAGNNSYAKADSARIVRGIQAYHVKGHGWCDIGYNFLVDKYGQIFEGRRGGIYWNVRAAHSGNATVNTYTMGVSMMGNYDVVRPQAALKDAVVKLVGWRMGTTYLKAKGTYSLGGKTLNMMAGHRDVVSTGCPGKYGYAWLSETGGLRDRVEDYISRYSSPIKTLATSLGTGTTGLIYRGEYPTTIGRRAIFAKGYITYTVATKKAVAYNSAGVVIGSGGALPPAATGLKAVPSTSSATLSWLPVSGATNYTICLNTALTATGCTQASGKIAKTSIVVTGLTPRSGTDYVFKVYAYNAAGHSRSAYRGFDLVPASSGSPNLLTVPSSRTFTLKGHGYGHGIGMSQYGAQGAAIKGQTYDQILRYYYKGTKLGTRAGNIRVLLSRDTTPDVIVKARSSLQFRNLTTNKITKLPAKVGSATVAQWRIVPVTAAPTRSVLQYKTTVWKTYNAMTWTGDAQFEAPGTSMYVVMPNGTSTLYRNIVRSALPKAGSTDRNTVNIVSLEHYVRGVISAEMPSSWKAEALKAQAVAARTYGVFGLRPSRSFDMCDTTACQVYRGVSAERATTNAAAKATSGKIVTYLSKPAFTQFSSSSGGRTTAGSQPYLIEAPDGNDDYAANPMHSWKISIAASTVEKKWPTIGMLKTIKVTKRIGRGDFGGRVVYATLTGSKGSKTVTGNDLRFKLGLRSNWFAFN